jgi:thiol-disulfide isomerase/thioredoxin
MGAPLHWIIFALAALLAAAAGCSNGNDAETESPTVPTPDLPAAGSESDPGKTKRGDSMPAATSTRAGSLSAGKTDAAEIKLEKIAPGELDGLVAQHKGKVVLFDFWATWCVPCVQQYPHTVELSEKHPDDLVVYTVSFDEPDDDSLVKKFHAEHGLGNVHALICTEGAAEESYEGFDITGGALPHYKVFDRDGKLAATLGGDVENPPDSEKVEAMVAKVLGK